MNKPKEFPVDYIFNLYDDKTPVYLKEDADMFIKEYKRLCESFTNILEPEQSMILKKDIEEFEELKKLL